MTITKLLKQPTGFLPLAMSLAAFALLIGFIARYGIISEPDEGSAAHIFQLLMIGQVPIIGVFAIKWLRRAPLQALTIVVVQIGAAIAAIGTVALLEM